MTDLKMLSEVSTARCVSDGLPGCHVTCLTCSHWLPARCRVARLTVLQQTIRTPIPPWLPQVLKVLINISAAFYSSTKLQQHITMTIRLSFGMTDHESSPSQREGSGINKVLSSQYTKSDIKKPTEASHVCNSVCDLVSMKTLLRLYL